MYRHNSSQPPPLPPLRMPSLNPPPLTVSSRPPSVSPLPPESPPAPPIRPQQPPISVIPIPPTQPPPQPQSQSPAILTANHISIPKELIGLKITSSSLNSKQKAPSPRASKGKELIRQQNSSKPLTLAALYGFSPLPDVSPPVPESPSAEVLEPASTAANLGPMSFSDVHFSAPSTATPMPEPPIAEGTTPAPAVIGSLSSQSVIHLGDAVADIVNGSTLNSTILPADRLWADRVANHLSYLPNSSLMLHRIGVEIMRPNGVSKGTKLKKILSDDMRFTLKYADSYNILVSLRASSSPRLSKDRTDTSDTHTQLTPSATNNGSSDKTVSSSSIKASSSSSGGSDSISNSSINNAIKKPAAAPHATSYLAFFSEAAFEPLLRQWQDAAAQYLSSLPQRAALTSVVGESIRRPSGIPASVKLRRVLEADERFNLREVAGETVLLVELVEPPSIEPVTDTVEPEAEQVVGGTARAKSPPPPSPLSHHSSQRIEEGQVEDEDATPERQPSPAPVFPLPPLLPEHMLNAHRLLQPSKSSLSTSLDKDTDSGNYDTNTTNINTNKNVHIQHRLDDDNNSKRQKLIKKSVKFVPTYPTHATIPAPRPLPSLSTASSSAPAATTSPLTSPRSSYITRAVPSGSMIFI